MRRTGVVKDPIYLEHLTGEYHPESHQRLEILYNMLEDQDISGKYSEIKPRFSEPNDLQMVHAPQYISKVAQTARLAHSYLDPDTQTSPRSYDAARLAVGGIFEAIDMVNSNKIDNAFAMIRPPGHHAEMDRGMGFCLFNNVALGARYAQKVWGLKKIMIIDWDLHHGNGTQNAFYEDSDILYCSTHQYPYYPGTGHFKEVGRGKGEGYTVNVPLSTGQGNGEYIRVFQRTFKPISKCFKPNLILVSAGFDIYFKDPLGGMVVTKEGFALLTKVILEMAEESCGGKLVVALEGGYHLEGLRESAKAVLKELLDESIIDKEKALEMETQFNPGIDKVISSVIEFQNKYWGKVFYEDH